MFPPEMGALVSYAKSNFAPAKSGEFHVGIVLDLLPKALSSLAPSPLNHLCALLRLHPGEEAVSLVPFAFIPFAQHSAEDSME